MNESFFQSSEFKRASGNVTNSGIKLLFKWIVIGIAGVANTVKTIIMSIIGK